MKRLMLLALMFIGFSAFAQQQSFNIFGTLIAEDSKLPLESATIYLEKIKDSSLVTYTISDKDGKFELEGKSYEKKLNLFITYIGYKTYQKNIDLDGKSLDLGTINLQVDNNQLDEVIVKSRAPITVKKDTLEFNVKSFKTKKDANVEDLLKELPGVEVDDEGKILVNGKEVSQILVNGKPFFGNDPTITTRNLTKELIDKVQITDTKTDAEAFTGEKGDSETKTINLTIKKENNKGVFGRVSAGAGTDERYEFAGMLNRFNNDRRISVLAGGNNTNSPGFSFGEIQKMFGGGNSIYVNSNGSFRIDGRSFGGGQGIVTSKNVGANYADDINENVEVSADYFYSESKSENESKVEQENILPDTRFFTNSRSNSRNKSKRHAVNAEIEIKLDSMFKVSIQPSFSYADSFNRYNDSSESLDNDGVLTNQSSSNSISEQFSRNFQNDIELSKRFGNKGSFLRFDFETEFSNTKSDNFLNSEILIVDPTEEDVIRDQLTNGDEDFTRARLTAKYRLPLVAKKLFLDFETSYLADNRNRVNTTLDFNEIDQTYSDFNFEQSTDFRFFNKRLTPSVELSYEEEKYSMSFQSGYVFRTLESRDQLRPELSLKETFEAVELGANFNMQFNDKMSMYSGYNLSNRPPQLSQLNPFVNVRDPLNIITGNPNLEPVNDHNFYFGFNSFNFQKGSGFYAYANGSIVNNQIVAKTTVDENFVRNTTYTNVDGTYRFNGSASYNGTIKVDSTKTLKWRVGAYGNINRSVNFNDDVQYASVNRTVGPSARFTFNWKKILEFRPAYSLSITNNSFNIPDFEGQNFVTHSVNIRTALFVPKKFEWRNNVQFSYNPNVADGFQKDAWFWNSTLAYSFMKDKATLTLKAYDILKQNTNARRTASQNYIQDSQSTVLQQYFMLSFSWKFNSLGKKGEVREHDFSFF